MDECSPNKSISERDLECQICLSMICEPVTIPCGHSFCRLCLVQAMRRSNKQCVICRAVCHISAEDASENVMIKNIACAMNPDLYVARKAEVQAEREAWQLHHPVFFYNSVMFPGEVLKLHLFEPRYKEMMKRLTSGSNCFAYACVRGGMRSAVGCVALLARVSHAQFTTDGRCFVMATLQHPRYKLTEVYEEPGTGGLHYGRMEQFHDLPPSPNEHPCPPGGGVAALIAECRMLVDILFPANEFSEEFSALPVSGDEALSLHIMGRIQDIDRYTYLASDDTLQRLRAAAEALHGLHSRHIAETTNGGILQSAVSNIFGAMRRLREVGTAAATVEVSSSADDDAEGTEERDVLTPSPSESFRLVEDVDDLQGDTPAILLTEFEDEEVSTDISQDINTSGS